MRSPLWLLNSCFSNTYQTLFQSVVQVTAEKTTVPGTQVGLSALEGLTLQWSRPLAVQTCQVLRTDCSSAMGRSWVTESRLGDVRNIPWSLTSPALRWKWNEKDCQLVECEELHRTGSFQGGRFAEAEAAGVGGLGLWDKAICVETISGHPACLRGRHWLVRKLVTSTVKSLS